MGRGIDIIRKINNDRVRKVRKQKYKVLIACEGNNKTEKNYFNNFESSKSKFNISYTKGNDTDPLKLVKMLIEEINKLELDLDGRDIAYLIFDTDTDLNKNKIISDAIKLARKKKIKVITSTPCIELWFLLHFEYTTSYMNSDEVIKRLRKYFPKYKKSINIYPYINNNTDNAICNAKRLEKYQIAIGNIIESVEANTNTLIYKIVEELKNN